MNASEDVTQSVVCSSSLHHVVEVHLSKKNKIKKINVVEVDLKIVRLCYTSCQISNLMVMYFSIEDFRNEILV